MGLGLKAIQSLKLSQERLNVVVSVKIQTNLLKILHSRKRLIDSFTLMPYPSYGGVKAGWL